MPKKGVAVVEIGSSSINVLVGNKGVNDTFVIYGSGEASYAGFYDGEFLEEDKLKSVITKSLQDAKLSSGMVIDKLYVGVPAEFSICQTKSLTQNFGQRVKVAEESISMIFAKANDFDNDEYILVSCSPISYVLDDGKSTVKPIGQKTTKITANLSLIYAEKKFITKMNDIFKSIGISMVEYLSCPLCESQYLLEPLRRTQKVILIDCGYLSTSVMVVQGEGLTLLKSFSVGGAHISADLCECLGISYEEADELRNKLILSVVPNEKDDYEIQRIDGLLPVSMLKSNEIAEARIEMIGKLIDKCLEVYKQNLSQMPYYLTGGGISYIKGGRDYLAKSMDKNITLVCPLDIRYAKPHYSKMLGILNTAIKQENLKKSFFAKFIDKIREIKE